MSSLKVSPSKLSTNGPISAPSPTPSASSNTGNTLKKRKRENPNPSRAESPVDRYLAPTPMDGEAMTGAKLATYVDSAIERLRESQDQPLTLNQTIAKISFWDRSQVEGLRHALAAHERIQTKKEDGAGAGSGAGGRTLFSYRPKYPVRGPESLKEFLQKRTDMRAVLVQDLKDGWPDAAKGIDLMGQRNEVLVTRHKKDPFLPKAVWPNDPSLRLDMDANFRKKWHEILLPANPDELRNKLEAAGLKPTSAPREVVKGGLAQKKKKAARRGGKTTNTHMAGILRDYSGMRK